MATTEAAFYDVAMTSPDEPAMLPLEESPWLPLYQQAAALLNPADPVVDLGCGTGRFAELLRRRGHSSYVGLDFSPAAIAECDRYVSAFNSDTDWRRDFDVCDLRTWIPDARRASLTAYVCLETLEHLDDDRDLIRRIPPGHRLIFSVPNHPSVAHLRVFENAGDAWSRYADLLEFSGWQLIGDGRHRVHLYRARRRTDSW